MEQRQIYVVNTRDNSRKTIMSTAETLAELKADLTANGINHEGLEFMEGLSGTHLLGDESQLPRNLMHDGARTNNLVVMLTAPKTKIKNGALTREEAYKIIQDDNLQDETYAAYGKNFTNCSTAELIALLEGHGYGLNNVPEAQHSIENNQEETSKEEIPDWLKDTDIDNMVSMATEEHATQDEDEENSTPNISTNGLEDGIHDSIRICHDCANDIEIAIEDLRNALINIENKIRE